jgi:hypothetical protein
MTQPVNLPDYGQTLSCVFDIGPMGEMVSGLTALSQALVRRITTPRGRLLTDPNYGYDVNGELNDDVTAAQVGSIAANMDQEFLKDQRVFASSTTAALSPLGELDTVSSIQSALGPFTLTLNVSQLTGVTQVLGQ